MGSLPNLHELGREHLVQQTHLHAEVTPTLGQPHNKRQYSIQQDEDANRILHRHSTHCRTKRSIPQPFHRVHQHSQLQHQKNVDDFILEHMAISYKTRRRADSLNSSIGANSVRRLIGVVRQTSGRGGAVWNRPTLVRNLAMMCASHSLITAAHLPFLALQGATSVWVRPLQQSSAPHHIGALLLALLHLCAAVGALLGPPLTHVLGTNGIIAGVYLIFAGFYLAHLYPLLPILIPLYMAMGICLGALTIARLTFIMTLAGKINCAFGEEDHDEELRIGRRTCIVRRVARCFLGAQDLGMILGSLLASALITSSNLLESQEMWLPTANGSMEFFQVHDLFQVDELDARICGSQACPHMVSGVLQPHRQILPSAISDALLAANALLCFVAFALALFLNQIKLLVWQGKGAAATALRTVGQTFRDPVLRFSATSAFFIGVEQAFMYADFGRMYVVCTLGLQRVNLVFLAMGVLQSIAACTLSMLLRTIQRNYVIFVGFTFHCCLLMVQLLWKPIGDDPALFYVISASWGVCNAVWEMMNFTLITGVYPDNWAAPFANALFFRYLGHGAAFALHGYVCVWLKIYLIAALLVAAVIPAVLLERKLATRL